jgi:dipeptidyl aminopeptidase/acylaminoacyl peptidase
VGICRCFVAAFAAILVWGAAQAAPLPVERFVEKAAIVAPKLSPSGRYLATPVRRDGKTVIAVHDLDASKGTAPVLIHGENLDVDWVEWATEDRMLVSFVGTVTLKRTVSTSRLARQLARVATRRVIAVDRDGKNPIGLMTPDRRFQSNRNLNQIAHMLPGEPDHVLMAANDPRSRFNLYRVNIRTGELVEVAQGNIRTDAWLTDQQGTPRARWDYDYRDEMYEMYLRRGDSNDWDKAGSFGDRDLPDLNVVGFSDPKTAIVASRQASDMLGLYEFDMVSRRLGRKLFDHAKVDVGSPFGDLLYDRETRKVLGLTYAEDLWRVHYFDADLARIQDEADTAFPDSAVVRLISWSSDKLRVVLYTQGPRNPGAFHLLDRKTRTSELLGREQPSLPSNELGDMVIIKYAARDGTKITGYLTMPPGRGDKNLPMVVMPHGGPELRDSVQFDEMAQAIANQGYLVFQPNFRGSGGYGRGFAEAGHRQWGRRMQDDITDGVKALIADGSADPKRICIVGASYGGYAALAGGAYTPQLYRCVVSVAGVSDLNEIVLEERKEGRESSVYRYWVKRIGDPDTDEAELRDWSPAAHADKFTAPVLLIHGEYDGIVPFDQSRIMDSALSRAGKQVELIKIRGEGHSFVRPASRQQMYNDIRRFLAQHLGN